MDMPPEVEQLLHAGPNSEMLFLSLSFCRLTDPPRAKITLPRAVLQTFLYHCRMDHDDGGL